MLTTCDAKRNIIGEKESLNGEWSIGRQWLTLQAI